MGTPEKLADTTKYSPTWVDTIAGAVNDHDRVLRELRLSCWALLGLLVVTWVGMFLMLVNR